MLVIDREGVEGHIVPDVQARKGQMMVRLDADREVVVPADALHRRDAHSYEVPFSFRDCPAIARSVGRGERLTVPVIEEQLTVQKRPTVGGVRLEKQVQRREAVVNVPTFTEEVRVERVPVNRELRRPLATHYEGDTLVVPVMEEVLVTEKRLVLRELLRISKRKVQRSEPRRVVLRREQVVEKPIGAKDGSPE